MHVQKNNKPTNNEPWLPPQRSRPDMVYDPGQRNLAWAATAKQLSCTEFLFRLIWNTLRKPMWVGPFLVKPHEACIELKQTLRCST